MTPALRQWLRGLRAPGHPDELEVKELLAAHGIAVPRGERLASGEPLGDGARPSALVVKVCGPDLLHKTEAGAVALGVERRALAEVVARLRAGFPACDLLIEEQIAFEPPECIVGALFDRDFGAAVMVGAGGIFAEVYGDVGFRLAPCPAGEARHLLRELRLAPVFDGARGASADAGQLAEVVARVADVAADFGDRLSQLDVNPMVWSAGRWVALDAAAVLSPTTVQASADASPGA